MQTKPRADAPTAATIGRFYVVTSINKQVYWAFLDGKDSLVLHPSPLMAEAFKMEEMPTLQQMIRKFFPNIKTFPMECNTRAIVPAELRKLINA